MKTDEQILIRSLRRPMLMMALPMVATQCTMALMQFADAWMIGALGKEPLAAIAAAGMMILSLSTFGTGFLAGAGVFVGHCFGKNDHSGCKSYGIKSLIFAIFIGLLTITFFPTAPFLFGFFDHEFAVFELEVLYFQICIFAILPQLIAASISFYFVAIQKPMISTLGAVVATLLNFVLSFGLIFGRFCMPELGLAGAAWGTVIASSCHALVMIAFLLRKSPPGKINIKGGYAKIAKTAIPTGIQDTIDVISWGVIIVFLIGKFGVDHLAACTVLLRCIQLAFLPAEGVGIALMALVARSVGSGNHHRAILEVKAAIRLVSFYMITLATVIFVFRSPLMGLFTDDFKVIQIGSETMLFVSLFMIFDALNIVYVQALTGVGDTIWTSSINAVFTLFVLLGGGLLTISVFPELQSTGIWIVATIFISLQGMALMFRWQGQNWKCIALFSE